MVLVIAGLIYKKYGMIHHWKTDKVHSLYMMIPAFIFALLFHSNLNGSYFSDVRWAFAEYLESLCLFPMIYVMYH